QASSLHFIVVQASSLHSCAICNPPQTRYSSFKRPRLRFGDSRRLISMNTIPVPSPKPSLRIASARQRVPPLENGAQMKSDEFLRRYKTMPDVKKAELIEGITFLMASPVRVTLHGDQDGIIHTILGLYGFLTPNVRFDPNCTVKLDEDNTLQPDAL